MPCCTVSVWFIKQQTVWNHMNVTFQISFIVTMQYHHDSTVVPLNYVFLKSEKHGFVCHSLSLSFSVAWRQLRWSNSFPGAVWFFALFLIRASEEKEASDKYVDQMTAYESWRLHWKKKDLHLYWIIYHISNLSLNVCIFMCTIRSSRPLSWQLSCSSMVRLCLRW